MSARNLLFKAWPSTRTGSRPVFGSRTGNPSMDPYTMMIMISIANVVGWLAGMYVKNALPGLMGHVVISPTGAFVGGYLALRVLGDSAKFSMIISAFVGAALLLYVVRLRNWRP